MPQACNVKSYIPTMWAYHSLSGLSSSLLPFRGNSSSLGFSGLPGSLLLCSNPCGLNLSDLPSRLFLRSNSSRLDEVLEGFLDDPAAIRGAAR